MTKSYSASIPAVTLSGNKLGKMHWSRVRGDGGYRDEWYWLIKSALHVHSPARRVPALVSIVRVSKYTLDHDNFVAGCKYLVDALREYGHIHNDSPEWVRVEYQQRKARKFEKEHMVVVVSDAE